MYLVKQILIYQKCEGGEVEFILDFADLETLEKLLREVAEDVEEFETAFSNIIDEIGSEASAATIGEIIRISEDIVPEINKLAAGYEEQADIAKNYIEGIRDINEDTFGIYELDTDEANGYIKDITNELENIEGMSKEGASLDAFQTRYKNNIRKYYDVEASINLEVDYEDDEETKALIRSRRTSIDDSIANYKNNLVQLDEAKSILDKLNDTMLDYIDDLAEYKEILEDLIDFEETFNPGYWDKHPINAKIVNSVTTGVEVVANKLVLDELPESEWYEKRHEQVSKLLIDNDLEAKAFYATDDIISPMLGFEYNEVNDYYFTNDTSIQSKFGFWNELDHMGPTIGMDLNTEVVTFVSGTSEYRLQLWKGEYAFDNAYGAEVGLYSRPISDAIENPYDGEKASSLNIQYDALPESEQIDIKNEIFDENKKLLISNDTSRYEENHYWNLAIQTSEKEGAKDMLYTKSTLTIEDDEFREDLYRALKQDDDLSSVSLSDEKVSFIWK